MARVKYVSLSMIIVALSFVAICAMLLLRQHGANQENPHTSVDRSYQALVSNLPLTFEDKSRWAQFEANLQAFRETVRQDPNEAVDFIPKQSKYIYCAVEEILSSGDMRAIERVAAMISEDALPLNTRREILLGMVPEEYTGDVRFLAGKTVKKFLADTAADVRLRAAAATSLAGTYGAFVANDAEAQEIILREWSSLASSPEVRNLHVRLLQSICAGVSWGSAKSIVLDFVAHNPMHDEEEMLQWAVSMRDRFANIKRYRGTATADELSPSTADTRVLLSEVYRLYLQSQDSPKIHNAMGVTLSTVIAFAPGDMVTDVLQKLVEAREDDVLVNVIYDADSVPVNNIEIYGPGIFEHAISEVLNFNGSISARRSWLSALIAFVENDDLPLDQLIGNRAVLVDRFSPLLEDKRIDDRDKRRVKELIELCRRNPRTVAAWDRVGQAGERLQKLVDSNSVSVDDYSRIALDALLDLKIDTYKQAMSKVAQFGPKSQLGLRLKASTGMYVNLNIQKYKANLDELVAAYPDFADGYGQRAYCYLKSGEYEKASADVKKTAELGPNSSVTYLAWGMMLMNRHDFVAATEKLKKAVSLTSELKDPNVMPEDFVSANLATETWLGLGVSLFAQSKWNEAGEQFSKCLEKFRMNDEVLLWAYVSALLSGDTAAPKDLLTKWVKDVRGYKLSTGAQNNFIGLLVEGVDSAVIVKLLADNRNSASWSGDGRYVAGKWLENKGETELAKAYFAKAAQMAKDFFFAATLADSELTKMDGEK